MSKIVVFAMSWIILYSKMKLLPGNKNEKEIQIHQGASQKLCNFYPKNTFKDQKEEEKQGIETNGKFIIIFFLNIFIFICFVLLLLLLLLFHLHNDFCN